MGELDSILNLTPTCSTQLPDQCKIHRDRPKYRIGCFIRTFLIVCGVTVIGKLFEALLIIFVIFLYLRTYARKGLCEEPV